MFFIFLHFDMFNKNISMLHIKLVSFVTILTTKILFFFICTFPPSFMKNFRSSFFLSFAFGLSRFASFSPSFPLRINERLLTCMKTQNNPHIRTWVFNIGNTLKIFPFVKDQDVAWMLISNPLMHLFLCFLCSLVTFSGCFLTSNSRETLL